MTLAIAMLAAMLAALLQLVPPGPGGMAFLVLGGAFLLASKRWPDAVAPPRGWTEIDELGVYRFDRRGRRVESALWAEITTVHIFTTGDGPGAEDFFVGLGQADGKGCIVPNDDAVRLELIARLQRLPGFDNAALIRACGSTDDGRFLCWQGARGDAEVADPES